MHIIFRGVFHNCTDKKKPQYSEARQRKKKCPINKGPQMLPFIQGSSSGGKVCVFFLIILVGKLLICDNNVPLENLHHIALLKFLGAFEVISVKHFFSRSTFHSDLFSQKNKINAFQDGYVSFQILKLNSQKVHFQNGFPFMWHFMNELFHPTRVKQDYFRP